MSGARRARAGEEGGPAVNRAARCPGLRRPETPPSAPPEPPGARPAAAPGLRPGAERLPLRARAAQSLQLPGPVPRVLRAQRAPPACEHRLRAVSAGPGGGWAAGCASCGARGDVGPAGDVALVATAFPPRPPRPGHPCSVFLCWGSAGGCLSPPSLLLIHWRPICGYLVMVLKWHRLNRRLCSAALGGVRVEVRVAEERRSLAEELCTRPAPGCPWEPLCLWRSDPRPLTKGDSVCQHREMGVDLTPSQSVGPVIGLSQKQIVQMQFPVIFY